MYRKMIGAAATAVVFASLPFVVCCQARAAEHKVSSAADVARLAPTLAPGDVLVMNDGQWQDQTINFTGQGTAQQPITLRAQTAGKVVLVGDSRLIIDGEHLIVSGVFLDNCKASSGDGIAIKGHSCRLTDTAVVGGQYKFFVHFYGFDGRMDHCDLAGKTTESPTLQIEVDPKQPNHDRIDHNHFGPRPPLGKNGGETMRVGYSHQSMYNSGTVVEENLFDRCDGEIEIISSKSCENVYRGNTFLDCAGMLTLRHGNRCRVEENIFLAHHKKGSGGIRVIGEDHVLVNNYIDGVDKGGFWITSGIVDSPLVGYFQAKRAVIDHNTVVDSKGPYLELDAGMGTSKRTLRPEKITITNNFFSLPKEGGTLLKGTEGEGFKWEGNLVGGGVPEHAGMKLVEGKVERGENGLLATSGAGAAIKGRALSAKDVGPGWMEGRR
jgi:poly(beta-D-mannuronate) lyase